MASRERNLFDLVRLFAAMMVFVSHGWPLATGSNTHEPMMRLSGGQLTLGAVGVDVFFVLSGYLIAQSWVRDPSLYRFTAKRVRRIMPGLIGAVAWTILVLPLIGGVVDLRGYYSNPLTWRYARAATLFWPYAESLPGLFAHNPYGGIVNGSLWTLEYEVICYGLVALAGLVGLFHRRWSLLALAGAVLALQLARVPLHRIPYLNVAELLRLGIFFALGSVAFLYRDKIRWSAPLGALSAALWLLACMRGYGIAGTFLFLPYPVLLVSCGLGWGVRLKNDISYGMYIFAFPLEQAVAHHLGARVSPLMVMVCALPLVIGMAALSWFAIERRFLRHRVGVVARNDNVAKAA